MPIAETIAALKGALDVSKIVNDLVNRSDIDVVEVRSKVHQMLIHVVNAQTGLAETQMEIYDLQQQLNDRERLRIIEADLEIDPDGQSSGYVDFKTLTVIFVMNTLIPKPIVVRKYSAEWAGHPDLHDFQGYFAEQLNATYDQDDDLFYGHRCGGSDHLLLCD
jgi:hypothetical protein